MNLRPRRAEIAVSSFRELNNLKSSGPTPEQASKERGIFVPDRSAEELDDLLQFAQAHSPVCNTVCRPVPVAVQRVKR